MDAWTSPNYYTYVAVMAHIEVKSELISIVLNAVEVAQSHSGWNLALAFAKILNDLGIEKKVRTCISKSHLGS